MPIDLVHMDKTTYEAMCAALCAAEFDAIHIEANPGDGGIDSFEGSLLEEVNHIWQYKHFPDGIGESQKSQIRESLKTAIKNYHPKEWTLLIPCDLDQSAQKWFEKQRVEFAKQCTEVNCMGATELSNLIRRHKTIRQDYFPTTDNQVKILTSMLGGRDAVFENPKSKALDLMSASAEYINDDPDWDYRFSWQDDVQTVEAVLANPNAKDKTAAQFELTLPNNATGKKVRQDWIDMQKKGTPFSVDGKHVRIKKSVFDGLVGEGFTLTKMQMIPAIPDRRLPMRLTFTSGAGNSATLRLVDLRLKRQGSDEALFTNEDQNSVLIVSLTMNSAGGAIHFKTRDYVGRTPTEAALCEDVLAVIAEGDVRLEMEHIESGLHLGAAVLNDLKGGLSADRELHPFFKSLATIERSLDPTLRVPESYHDRDVPAAERLAKILTDGELTAQGSTNLTLNVGDADGARKSLAQNEPVEFPLDESTEEVKLLGKTYVFDTTTSIMAPLVLVDTTAEELVDGASFTVRQEGLVTRKYTHGRVATESPE